MTQHYKDSEDKVYGFKPKNIEVVEITIEEARDLTAPKKSNEQLLEEQTSLTHTECKRRIYSEWDADQQWNALAGASGYTEQDKVDCLEWVDACRASRDVILKHTDFLSIDVTDDQYWPVYAGVE